MYKQQLINNYNNNYNLELIVVNVQQNDTVAWFHNFKNHFKMNTSMKCQYETLFYAT